MSWADAGRADKERDETMLPVAVLLARRPPLLLTIAKQLLLLIKRHHRRLPSPIDNTRVSLEQMRREESSARNNDEPIYVTFSLSLSLCLSLRIEQTDSAAVQD